MTLGEAPERAHQVHNGISGPNSPDPAAVRRRLPGRRRALPSGRAVVGGLLIALAAVAVFAAALRGTNQDNNASFVVAARTLQAGSVIEPADLTTTSMRLPRDVSAGAYTSVAALAGRTLAVGMARGQLLETPMLVPAGGTQAVRPVTVPVDASALGGLYAGEPVDVLQTGGADASATVTVVLRGATLLALSRPGSNLFSGPSTASVTLGVSSLQEVEAVVAAAHAGSLTIVAAAPEDGVGPGAGDTGGSTGPAATTAPGQ